MSLTARSLFPRLFNSSSNIGGPLIVPFSIKVRSCSGSHFILFPCGVQVQKPSAKANCVCVNVHSGFPRWTRYFDRARALKKSSAEIESTYSGAVAATNIHPSFQKSKYHRPWRFGTSKCRADQVQMKIVAKQLQRMDQVPRPFGSCTHPWTRFSSLAWTLSTHAAMYTKPASEDIISLIDQRA